MQTGRQPTMPTAFACRWPHVFISQCYDQRGYEQISLRGLLAVLVNVDRTHTIRISPISAPVASPFGLVVSVHAVEGLGLEAKWAYVPKPTPCLAVNGRSPHIALKRTSENAELQECHFCPLSTSPFTLSPFLFLFLLSSPILSSRVLFKPLRFHFTFTLLRPLRFDYEMPSLFQTIRIALYGKCHTARRYITEGQ